MTRPNPIQRCRAIGTSRGVSMSATWNPSRTTGFVSGIFPALSLLQGKLFQDSAKTTLAAADTDPVYTATCPYSGLDWATTADANRTALGVSGDYAWLAYNGTTSLILRAISMSQPFWFYAAGLATIANGTFADGQSVNRSALHNTGGAINTNYTARGGAVFSSSNTTLIAEPVVAGVVWNGAASKVILNNVVTVGDGGTNSVTSVYVGTRSTLVTIPADRIYGFACGTGSPSDSELANLFSFFSALVPP